MKCAIYLNNLIENKVFDGLQQTFTIFHVNINTKQYFILACRLKSNKIMSQNYRKKNLK